MSYLSFKMGWGSSESAAPTEDTPLLKDADTSNQSFFIWFVNEYDTYIHFIFGGCWILAGVCMFCWVERCWILTGFYEIVQIVTTIGYGDFVPENTLGRILTVFYALGTILFLGSMINQLIDSINARLESAVAAAEAAGDSPDPSDASIGGRVTASLHAFENLFPTHQDIHDFFKSICGHWLHFWHDFIVFALFIAAGTVFYGFYEACVCSYGLDAVEGCHETSYEICVHTGGYVLTWVDAFYMVVITLTTIGFGDYAPKSYLGRILFIPWALTGVIAMAQFATSFGAALSHATSLPKPIKSSQELEQDLKLLVGERKTVNRLEFAWFLLSQTKRISRDDEHRSRHAYKELDKNKTGSVGIDETLSYVQSHLKMFEPEDDESDC